jgi:D-alanyl-D-alanine carboxypeptidase
MLAFVIVASGCGTTEPSERAVDEDAPRALPQLRPAGDHPGGRPHDGTTRGPLDTSDPTVGRLDPDLLAALQAAARDAERDGVRMVVTSGWRSRAHQERLFADAVRRYGSEEEARRYVSTPDTSEHVTGDAVDVGATDADAWLSRYGAEYGLCQVYANEIWHYELATTPGGRCPDLVPDASSRR